MEHQYENIGIFPLEFRNQQQVEAGEHFTRDFEKSEEGAEHETWLAAVGLIRRIVEIPKVPARPERRSADRTLKTDSISTTDQE